MLHRNITALTTFPPLGANVRMRAVDSDSGRIYLRLLGFVRPHAQVFALAIGAMLALASTEWMLPALLKPLIDEDFDLASRGGVYLTPLLLVVLFAVRGALSYVGTVALHWVAQRTIADLRATMFQTLVRLPAEFFDARASGELISKFTFDVTQVAQASTRVITVMVKDSAVILVLMGYMLFLNWHLASLLLLLAPPVGFVIYRVSRRMREMSRRLQESVGDINEVAGEAVRGQREIKVFDGYEYENRRFGKAIDNARKFHMKVVRTSAMTVPIIQFFVAIGIGVMIVLSLRESAQGLMTRGDFVAFVTATALLLPPTKRLAGVNEFLQRGIAASESIFGLADAAMEVDEGDDDDEIVGRIRFEGVSLHYADRHALDGVDLEIAAGENVAFVGRSGGGKTSLVNLVPRFYEPTSGRIYIDDRPLDAFRLVRLRRHIAYVGQNVVLFNDSIRNNIAYGALRNVPVETIELAARQAQVEAFADALPDGLDTVVGENGVRLSGGQRQRVAIARAMLKDAPILILDEATAALDNEAEHLVQEALRALRAGRTSLIVAHRLSTIEQADRIVVLEGGRIVEVGTHATLLAAGAAYARLYAVGFAGEPEPEEPLDAMA